MRWLQFHRCILQRIGLLLPPRNLFHTALRILIKRNTEFFNQVLTPLLDEVRRVFGKMLGTLGHEISKPFQHFIAYCVRAAQVPAGWFGKTPLGIALLQGRIKILERPVFLLVLKLQIKRHVIDTSRTIANFAQGNIKVPRQFLRRALYRMTQAHLLDLRVLR